MTTLCSGKSAFLLVISLKVALAGYAVAQAKRTTTAPPATPRQGTPADSPHRGQIDMYLAEGILLDNETELELAKIAQTRAQSKDIVKFAEKMVEDHEQFAKDLQKYAGPAANRQVGGSANEADGVRARREPTAPDSAPRAKTGASPPVQPQAGGVRPQTSPQYDRLPEAFVQIHEEIAKECRESAQHELLSKKGAEFDKCYLGMQLGAHMKMINVLKVFERHASPELARVFEKGRETAQKHFDRAKEIMKDLEEGDRRETASDK